MIQVSNTFQGASEEPDSNQEEAGEFYNELQEESKETDRSDGLDFVFKS